LRGGGGTTGSGVKNGWGTIKTGEKVIGIGEGVNWFMLKKNNACQNRGAFSVAYQRGFTEKARALPHKEREKKGV